MTAQHVKLTKRTVEGCPLPSEGFIVLHDTELAGFHVRIYASGRRSYHLHYRHRGKERRPKIGEHGIIAADQARRTALEWKGMVAGGIDPADKPPVTEPVLTLAQLFDQFQKWAGPRHKPRTLAHNDYLFRSAIAPQFDGRTIDSISRAEVERFHAAMSDNPTKANHALTLLRTLFNKAIHWDLLIGRTNPSAGIQKLKEGRHERFLTREELNRLHQSLDHFETAALAPTTGIAAIRLLIHTGCRRGEILDLTWDQVDFVREELILKDSKTGRKRVLLNSPALEVLRQLQSVSRGRHVIHGAQPDRPLQGLEKIWQRIRRHAALEDVRLHDLRHSFASFGIAEGISLLEIGALLGHKDTRTTQRYAHLSENQVRTASRKLGTVTRSPSETAD